MSFFLIYSFILFFPFCEGGGWGREGRNNSKTEPCMSVKNVFESELLNKRYLKKKVSTRVD